MTCFYQAGQNLRALINTGTLGKTYRKATSSKLPTVRLKRPLRCWWFCCKTHRRIHHDWGGGLDACTCAPLSESTKRSDKHKNKKNDTNQPKGSVYRRTSPSVRLRCMYGCFSCTKLNSPTLTVAGCHRALSPANPSRSTRTSEGSDARRITVECIMSGTWTAALREQRSGTSLCFCSNSVLSSQSCTIDGSGQRHKERSGTERCWQRRFSRFHLVLSSKTWE